MFIVSGPYIRSKKSITNPVDLLISKTAAMKMAFYLQHLTHLLTSSRSKIIRGPTFKMSLQVSHLYSIGQKGFLSDFEKMVY